MSTTLTSGVPTSPRLPSPPPPVEDLSNPSSPGFLPTPSSPSTSAPTSTIPAPPLLPNRRIRKGTKAKDINGPPLIPLAELESAFQLQEHLSALISSITNPSNSDQIHPLSKADCEVICTVPEGVEEWLWCYELTRRLTRDLNYLVVGLLSDNCTEETCPEMRASLWQYLCAVHDPPRSCCAMDYSVHTLDHAASTLCSTKHFPTRLSINPNGTKQLGSIFRRLYRIFAHAWFLHRSVFWDVENEYGLYVFFKTVSDKYQMIPEDNLTIPTSAQGGYDGGDGSGATDEDSDFDRSNPGLLGTNPSLADPNNPKLASSSSSDHDSDFIEDDIDQDDFEDPTTTSTSRAGADIKLNERSLSAEDIDIDDPFSDASADADGNLNIKQDFPLFVFPEGEEGEEDDGDSMGLGIAGEEKRELHASEPPHNLTLGFDDLGIDDGPLGSSDAETGAGEGEAEAEKEGAEGKDDKEEEEEGGEKEEEVEKEEKEDKEEKEEKEEKVKTEDKDEEDTLKEDVDAEGDKIEMKLDLEEEKKIS